MKPERAAQLLAESEPEALSDARAQAIERRVLAELRPDAPSSAHTSRFGLRALAVTLASLALAALVLLVFRGGSAEQLPLSLTDGSQVTPLGSGARVVPELIAENRVELRQAAGSVAYQVTARPSRVFVVRAGDARVEVLGTAFRIDLSERAVHVAVTRGLVRVAHGNSIAQLAAGEEVTLARASNQVSSAPSAAASADPSIEPDEAQHGAAAPAASMKDGSAPSAAELFLRADQARVAGDSAGALRHLRELLRTHPKDGRATLARFTIGRLESSRGNARIAAEAFESCGSALGGEALAEAALARSAAGQTDRARVLATRYLKQFPSGPRAGALVDLTR
jgi:TolA-binding protein